MASFDDLEYCKTDLIAAKGIVFCKYSKTSSALKALESVQQTGLVSHISFLQPLPTANHTIRFLLRTSLFYHRELCKAA